MKTVITLCLLFALGRSNRRFAAQIRDARGHVLLPVTGCQTDAISTFSKARSVT
jgi:hypothetical protein